MEKPKEASDPSAVSQAYTNASADWGIIRDLLGGTRAMRDSGMRYLPKFDAEGDDTYRNRLQRATLTNVLKESVANCVSKPFSKALQLEEGADEAMIEWMKNVDSMGNSLTAWSWGAYSDGVAMGTVGILVDYPRSVPGETAADEKKRNPTPYLVYIKADDILACYVDSSLGSPRITYVRFRERFTRQKAGSPFEEENVERVRILEPGRFEVWEKLKTGTDDRASWSKIDEGTVSYPEVPFFVFFAGERLSAHTARPPFIDLAYKNIEHWQSSSDQRHILTFSRFAMLGVKGEGVAKISDKNDAAKFVLGPMQILKGEWYLIEPAGSAIEAGWKDLEKLEDDMRVMGLQPMVRRASGTVTATERALDGAEVHSQAQKMAIDFAATLSRAVKAAAVWMGRPDTVKCNVTINTEFGVSLDDAKEIDALIKMRATGEISRRTFWDECKRRNFLSPFFDPEREEIALEEEPIIPGSGDTGSGASAGHGG